MTKMFKMFIDELEELISSLENLLSRKDALGLEPAWRSKCSCVKTRVSERYRPTFVADESTFCGRKDIKETIIKSLRSADVRGQKMGVIPIIGAGGIGKTALAQIIYNRPDVKEHFPVKAWVIVSTEFDLPAVTKKIIATVSGSSQIDGNEDELPFKLKNALKGKRFLLVLDDVWSEDRVKWNAFMTYFLSVEHGSKIIVTTRSTTVASVVAPKSNPSDHVLPVLPEEDCLKLFDMTVFSDDQDLDASRHLQEIGKKIVKKCKGNPLSVTCVGGILCGERDQEKWEKVLESSVWELLQKDSEYIIPSLWLSYRYLPSHLKRCFAYCSIFPKDYLFRKKQIVQLSMAEGFLKNGAGGTMEEVGKQYFEDLISRSLFQRSSDDEETVIMHDLVHDLAIYVSGKFCVRLDEDKILRETRHLSYNLAIGDAKKFEGLSKAKRLHSFVGLTGDDAENLDFLKVVEVFLMEGVCLRVLSLSSLFSPYYNIDSLLDSVGKLKHLRYLNLSETSVTKLPDSICTLYNLQTLLLSHCRNLTRLPSNLGSLTNLHHLDTSYSRLEEMPPKMCNLKKLHTLTDFVLGKQSGSSIKDLGVLQDLHGRIRVSGLQNVNNVDDALKANLKNKKNLSVLALEWEGQSDERDSRHEEKVLEALQPHTSLKELTISKYEGTSFPDWDDRDNELKVLSIKECSKLEFLGNIHYESLEYLRIEQCEALKSISLDYLPKLNRFYLRNCQNFESFRFAEEPPLVLESLRCLDLAGLPKFVSFPEGGLPAPNLEDFFIYECENLRSLPQQMQRLLPSNLESLHIWGCKKLAAQVMHWDLQTLTPCLREFWIDGCGKELLDSFPPEGLLPTSLTSLAIKGFPHLKTLNIHAFQQLEGLTVVSCDELQCLPEESLPNSLFRLCIERCPLLERRYRKETGEGWHKISHILIVVIN